MAKVTNTGNAPLFIGTTQVGAHSTVDVPDEELAKAKENKMVESWFANGTLKMGEVEANPSGTSVHPNIDPKTGVTGTTGGVTHKEVEEDEDEQPKK